ncbi:hypothetical protein FAIPA1_480015 [Frankia sp. AiPs1]
MRNRGTVLGLGIVTWPASPPPGLAGTRGGQGCGQGRAEFRAGPSSGRAEFRAERVLGVGRILVAATGDALGVGGAESPIRERTSSVTRWLGSQRRQPGDARAHVGPLFDGHLSVSAPVRAGW